MRSPMHVCICTDKKVDVFEEGHGPEDVLPLLAQKAIRAAQTKGEEDTAEIQALLQHEMDFMQVSNKHSHTLFLMSSYNLRKTRIGHPSISNL